MQLNSFPLFLFLFLLFLVLSPCLLALRTFIDFIKQRVDIALIHVQIQVFHNLPHEVIVQELGKLILLASIILLLLLLISLIIH